MPFRPFVSLFGLAFSISCATTGASPAAPEKGTGGPPPAAPAARSPAPPARTVAGRSAPRKVTEVEGITEYQLENGLRVLLFPDPSKPTVTVNATYLVGSRHEGAGETGMAHLLEHLLFKGTVRHKNPWKELQD